MVELVTKEIDLNAPVWHLSTGQLISVIEERFKLAQSEVRSVPTIERVKIKTIRGLAKFLDVGLNKAQELKDSGKFPVYWTGDKCYFYSDEVENGIRDSK